MDSSGDQVEEEKAHIGKEKFFNRRKLEFDLLRNHINEVLNSRGKTKKQNLNFIELPPPHMFSDMRNFNLEPEKPIDIDYCTKPSFQPVSSSTGRGVRSSFNQYPKPYLAHGDSALHIVLESDRSQNDSPKNSALRSPTDMNVVKHPLPEMAKSDKNLELQVRMNPPQIHPSAYQKSQIVDHVSEIDRDISLLDLKLSPETGRNFEETENKAKKKGPYAEALNTENKNSLSYLHLLRSFIRDNNCNISLSQNPDQEPKISLTLENVNFDKFMERLLGVSRDYNYQNWNHFSKRGQLKFDNVVKKEKKVATEMDYTEAEKEWKSYLDDIPAKKLTRSACLEYQYNPEYCFNSMIDVIDFSRVVGQSDPRKIQLDKPKSMVYAPRVFNDPQDNLYQEGEFPFTEKRKKHALHTLRLYESEFPDLMANERSQKIRKLKREMYKTSKLLIKKDFYPLKNSNPNIYNQNLNIADDAGVLPLRKNQKKKSETPNEIDYKTAATVSDKFLMDFVELDMKHSDLVDLSSHEYKQKTSLTLKAELHSSDDHASSSDLEPEEWFEGIIENERPKEEINQINWSGEQVKATTQFSRHKMEVTIDSLNIQDLEIWLTGRSGFHRTLRKYLRAIMGHRYMTRFLLICVILNTVILSIDGLVDANTFNFLQNFNTFFTLIFLVTYLMSLWGYGWSYLSSYFNVFDGIVVVISVVELAFNFFTDSGENGGSAVSALRALRILRVFRVLRVTRILRSLKFITVIVTVITETVEQYLYVAIMLLLFLLIYALLGMQLYGGKLPQKIILPRANFDTFTNSFLTVLQLVTFENWTDHIVLLYNTSVSKIITLLFIISWLILGNYVFLNLFLALLLGGFESEEVIKSLQETVDEFKELKEMIKKKNIELKHLVNELEDNRVRESRNINYIINTDLQQQIYEEEAMFDVLSKEKLKNRGTYYLERGFKHDESSLDELLYQTLEEQTSKDHIRRQATIKKREIFTNVYCRSSLYLFSMKHPLRKFAASVVSHSWYSCLN